MIKIIPFKGYRFNKEKIKDISSVVSLPYDVISPTMQREYYNSSPYNIVRIILPYFISKHTPKGYILRKGTNDKYVAAKKCLDEWIKKKILIQEETPSFYILKQKFRNKNGRYINRIGLVCLVKLEEFSHKNILPHELTFPSHKQDRLKLLEECKANLSSIFGLFNGNLNLSRILKRKPLLRFKLKENDSINSNTVWRISDKNSIKYIQNAMRKRKIFIADGHHRYEVALLFKKRMKKTYPDNKDALWNYAMFCLFSLKEKGLEIMATHRVVKFVRQVSLNEIKDMLYECYHIKKTKNSNIVNNITIYKDKKFYELVPKDSLKWKQLPTSVLHYIILKKLPEVKDINYTRDINEVLKKVDNKTYDIGFLLPDITSKDIESIALRLGKMPHKTTYFYPKVPVGFVINKF